jgi:hypothetical protein
MLGVSLTEPEQAKSGTVSQMYLSSRWESVTGEGGRLDIIDFVCPHCHNNIYWQLWAATYCPHCNTPIFSAPRRKLDARQYRNWRHDDFLKGMTHDIESSGRRNPRSTQSEGTIAPPDSVRTRPRACCHKHVRD